MFAALADRYPGAEDGDLRAVLEDQIAAGIGMIGSGAEWDALADPGDLVQAWKQANALSRDIAGVAQVDPPTLKACLVGPYTAWRSTDAGGASTGGSPTGASLMEVAERVNSSARALFEAGAVVVQLGEPALISLGSRPRDEHALVGDAFDRALARLTGHVSLAILGGSAEEAGAGLLFDRPFSSYLFDLIHGPDNWRLIADAPDDRGIVCGVGDTRPGMSTDQAVMIWAARYAASLGGRGLDRVGLAAAAGLEGLTRDAARSMLTTLADAARTAALPAEELARSIDPRAVDARSAALGRVDTTRRRRR